MPAHVETVSLAGRAVCVTGAGGFIGSHLTEALVRGGAKVRALVHYNGRGDRGMLEEVPPEIAREVEVVAGDIRDPHHMLRFCQGQDTIFHLAALIAIPWSYEAPQNYVMTNVLGTQNLLEAARMCGARRIVHTSTSEVYGTARYVPIDEVHPLQGQSPYSASKIGADKLAESYFLSFGTPVVTLRPFNTYGPRQSARAVIPTIASQLLTKQPELKLGSLDPVRDLLFCRDTARAFVLAGTVNGIEGETVHVGTGVGVTIGDLAEQMMALSGHQVPIVSEDQRVRPAGSEVMRLLCNPAKAKELLGFESQVTLQEGLLEVLESVAARLDKYRRATEYQR